MSDLIHQLADRLLAKSADHRWLQGVAGIPGSGKSTLAEAIVERINDVEPGAAAIIPMDGFHFTNARLVEMGQRDFKGAPHTFDVHGYIDMLRKLRDAREHVMYPIYDRELHEPVMRGSFDPRVRIIITEGNYLLLDHEPWSALGNVLDACWYLETPIELAHDRIVARHARGGRSPDDAERHYQRSDLHNTQLVIDCRRTPDEVIPHTWSS